MMTESDRLIVSEQFKPYLVGVHSSSLLNAKLLEEWKKEHITVIFNEIRYKGKSQ